MGRKKISGECLILGCGNSTGVPVLGCSCEVCRSEDSRNHRLRPSVLIRCGKTSLLIDAGPDIREQLLRESITEIHGVFITHSHYDHTGGLDDLRILALIQQQAIPMWVGEETYIDLEKRMDYLIHSNITVGVPFKRFSIEKLVGDCGECRFDGFSWRYFLYTHSGVPVYGMRIGDFAYVTDIREYPESIFEELRGVRTLVVSALRRETSPLHFSIDEALAFGSQTGCQELYLTHFAHEVDYESISKELPDHAHLCYDGMRLQIDQIEDYSEG